MLGQKVKILDAFLEKGRGAQNVGLKFENPPASTEKGSEKKWYFRNQTKLNKNK